MELGVEVCACLQPFQYLYDQASDRRGQRREAGGQDPGRGGLPSSFTSPGQRSAPPHPRP